MPPSLLADARQRLPAGLPPHSLFSHDVSVPELCQEPLLIQPGHGVLATIEISLNALQNHPGILLVWFMYFGS